MVDYARLAAQDFHASDLSLERPELSEWALVVAFRGSIAHGCYVPSTDPDSIDDTDLMGVVVPPDEYYLGLREFGSRGTKEIKEGRWDIVTYELRKFMALLAGSNPNVLGLLWLRPEMYLKVHPAFDFLLESRKLFATREVYPALIGYAQGQMHKANHPATGLGYMGAKRKELVERFKFDCKNVSHAIRLLRMGVEFLRDGQLRVWREDAEELLQIKRGEWDFARCKAEADRLFEQAQIELERSPLPERVDRAKVSELTAHIARYVLGLTRG